MWEEPHNEEDVGGVDSQMIMAKWQVLAYEDTIPFI